MYDPTDLCHLVVDIASYFNGTMIVVDALDECGGQTTLVVELLTSLNCQGNPML